MMLYLHAKPDLRVCLQSCIESISKREQEEVIVAEAAILLKRVKNQSISPATCA